MKNFKVLILFLILALVISPAMFVDGKAFAIDLEKQQTIFENKIIVEQNDLTQKPRHNFITLHKSVSIHLDNEKKNSELQNVQHTVIDLHEKVSVSDISVDDAVINMIKGNDERKTIMERIFDRAKLQRIVFDSSMHSIEDDITLSSLTNEHQYEQSYSNLELEIDQRIPTSIIDFSISENYFDTFYANIVEINDQLVVTTNSLPSVDNPMFMLLVLPLAGFVLVRTENEKLNFNDLKRVFCFVFVTILISSAVITPLSISSVYWSVAYAEEFPIDNQISSDVIPINTIGSTATEPVEAAATEPEPVEAAATEPVEAAATEPEPVDFTATEPVEAVATEPEPVDFTATEPVETAATEPEPIEAAATEPVEAAATEPEPIEAAATEPVEAAATEPVEAAATEPEPIEAAATEPVEAAATEPVEATATEPEPVDFTATEPVEAAATEPVEATATEPEPVDFTATEPVEAAATEPVEATATEPEPVDFTATEPVEAAATEPEPVDFTATEPVEAAATEPVEAAATEPVEAAATEPEPVEAAATEPEPVDSTATEPVEAAATEPEPVEAAATEPEPVELEPAPEIIVPEATITLQFNDPQPESISENSASTESQTEEETLELSGDGDFIQIESVTVTNDLNGLTITAWVKPDYSAGSSEFTVLSKAKSFSLTINNNIQPQQIAKFSVYDGIKWTTIESTSIIPEKWTFLSSTFNGETIAIFVNGVKEGTKEIVGVPTLSVSGKLETTTVDSITSEEDIVIGATITTKNGNSTPSNQFSGEIDNVLLYDYVLEDEQIRAIYEQSKDTYAALDNIVELSIEELVAQIAAELAQNEILVEPVDATAVIQPLVELQVDPVLTSVKETYLISEDAELELEFYNEYDVLMNELTALDNAVQLLTIDVNQILQETTIGLDSASVNQISSNPVLNFINILFSIPQAEAANLSDEDASKIEIENTKAEIKKLKAQLDALKEDPNLTEEEIKAAKAQLKKVIDQIKATASQVSKTELKDDGAKLQKSADDVEKVGGIDSDAPVQQDNWVGIDETIVGEVYDYEGKTIPLKVSYEKLRDGKFSIKVEFDNDAKPGLYKLKTTLTVNGQTFVSESEFAWGLVSLNTVKSIYNPGETAEFVIVVLDNQGHPVCDANLSMSVTDPNSLVAKLSSGNEITANAECGLYDAEYITSIEGTYLVDINAVTTEINTNFSTTFDVLSFFEFDIIRSAQSKIDPITNPNSFDVRIDIESFVGGQVIEIKESVPSVFEVVTDANVQIVNDAKVLTWNKQLIGDKTFVEYSYSVPLEFPELYALGPIEINYGQSQTFKEARSWFVAVDPVAVIVETASLVQTSGTGTSLTLTGFNPSGADSVAIIIMTSFDRNDIVTSVTRTGDTPVFIVRIQQTVGNDNSAEIWKIVAPKTGAADVVITWDSNDFHTASVINYNGVDQITPNDAIRIEASTGNPSLAVTSETGDLVVDVLACTECDASVGAGQTVRLSKQPNNHQGFGSDEEGAAIVTMSWAMENDKGWAHAAVNLNAAPDTTKPTILSVVTGEAGVGLDKLTITFSEPVDAAGITGGGWTVTGNDGVGKTVTANTDPAGSSDTMVLTLSSAFLSEDPDATVTYTLGGLDLVDPSGNELAPGASPNITDGIAPTITSIKSDATTAGILKVGNTITFTLEPGSQETGGSVSGSYNGQTLMWNTLDSGQTFTATYTVTEGDPDQETALQISGVLLTDSARNTSAARSDFDVEKTIDANSPAFAAITPTKGSTIPPGFSVGYTLNEASISGSITFTRTGGSEDLGTHVYIMVVDDLTAASHTILQSTLEADAGLFNPLVDGSIYKIAFSATDAAANIGTAKVKSITFDATAPTLNSAATVTPTTIDVTFSEDLDGTTVAAGDFTVDSNTVPSAVESSAGVVTLTLGTAIATDARPLVTLVGSVSDVAGNAQIAGSTTPTDGIAPTMISAQTKTTTTIDVTFSEDLDETTVAATDFTVTDNTVSDASELAGVVTLTLETAIGTGATPSVTLGGNGVADVALNTFASAGPNLPTVAGTNNFITPLNAGATDNVCTTSGKSRIQDGFWKTFNFDIPTGDRIDGIQVEVKSSWQKDPPSALSSGVNIGKSEAEAGLATGKTFDQNGPKAHKFACGATQTTFVLGGADDLWGLTWTPAEINDAGFTVRLQNTNGEDFEWIVDFIRVTVFHTATGPIEAADGVAPVISSAATGPADNQITYTFSESLKAATVDKAGGTDFADVDDKSPTRASISGNDVTVTFSGDFATDFTATSAERLAVGQVIDDGVLATNNLSTGDAGSSVAITDGLAPNLDAAITGPDANQITYIFSENIDSLGSVIFGDFANVDGNSASSVFVSGTDVTVTFDGDFATDFTDGSFERFTKSASIDDTNGNSLTQSVLDTSVAILTLSADEELIRTNQETVTVSAAKPTLVVVNSGIKLASVNIPANVKAPIMSFSGIPGYTNKVIIAGQGLVINADNTGVKTTVTIKAGTQITGTGWDGDLFLPTPDTILISNVDVTLSVMFGGDVPLTFFPKPIKITLEGQSGKLAFITEVGTTVQITTTCDSADPNAVTNIPTSFPQACTIDSGDDLVILTKTASTFSTGRPSPSAPSGGSTGGGGNTGTGPGAAGTSGFGVILFPPLKIHEISYDVCTENMATILVANDDAVIPTVTLQTTKSGTIEAILATEQPFEERNQFTTVDKYLFVAPLDPKESFFMVQVKAASGTKVNTINGAVHITECQGIILFDEIPEEFEGIEFLKPRIFDVKIQIDSGTLQSAAAPETAYLDEQELTVSAIVNSQVPLKRAELRYVIAGQSEDDYIAFLMDINPLEGVYTASKISASIPPMFMVAPGIEYWIHVFDENLDESSSQHYTIGVKPSYDVDASLELDIPTSKPEGSTIRPSAYVINHSEEPAFGTVSLLVDGKVVSSATEFFGAGETKVTLEWVIPKERQYMVYAIQAKLDLYDTSATTEKAYVSSFMKTRIISISEMQTIQPVIDQAGNTVAQPALLYASDFEHDNMRFRVIGDGGFCFIGATDECAVKESTLGNRGGIQSIEHNGIIYRVKYSGADSPLERFSITSVDQVSANWNITLESVDDFIPQAFAMEDIHLKVKYRTISEMIMVSSE